ncbi:tRNA lysidine(34) synthetase TilS [Aliiglaciecola sp. LCG003]|uniref:tRNA lysidine(34) synthetase TilS n=1 Tax=Aliiglaciecola sp. LCG003 TaxID=3053655 RepID=UPI00257276ED|nr:tRNA lysidine(34) synthetase TilS [Aliiglaciecola sp. LCG003]WJG08520.1 tRNA lysidine(34) synthetase TilS [Aliiglaciecola sp. LCG003]
MSKAYLTSLLRDDFDCPARQIVVAYSGGVDSHLLLQLSAELRALFPQHRYLAVYIHHGMSANADQWQAHCQRVCNTLNFPFKSVRVNPADFSGEGLESAARQARYSALIASTEDEGVILLGQHQDDQFETFLLQLKRGAGPKGLSAMPARSQRERGITLVRPFLSIGREQIERLAQECQLEWVEDESNQNLQFDRNFLRQQIIPELKQRWPGVAKSVSRSAGLCADQQCLLEEVVNERLTKMIRNDGAIDIQQLLEYSQSWQNQIVRHWLALQKVPMPSQAVLSELSQFLNAKQDANPQLNWQCWQFRRYQQHLFCIPTPQSVSRVTVYHFVNRQLELPNGLGTLTVRAELDSTLLSELSVRSGSFAQSFKPVDARHSKPLKQWFKQWQIAPWVREQSLQLYLSDKLVGIIVDKHLIMSQNTDEQLCKTVFLSG